METINYICIKRYTYSKYGTIYNIYPNDCMEFSYINNMYISGLLSITHNTFIKHFKKN